MKRLHIIDSLLLMTLAFLCYEKLTNTVCMCSRGTSFRSPQLQFLHIDELLWPKKFHYLLHYTILKYLIAAHRSSFQIKGQDWTKDQ